LYDVPDSSAKDLGNFVDALVTAGYTSSNVDAFWVVWWNDIKNVDSAVVAITSFVNKPTS